MLTGSVSRNQRLYREHRASLLARLNDLDAERAAIRQRIGSGEPSPPSVDRVSRIGDEIKALIKREVIFERECKDAGIDTDYFYDPRSDHGRGWRPDPGSGPPHPGLTRPQVRSQRPV